MKRIVLYGGLALALYVLSYLGFRSARTEVWEQDGRPYVIYPANGRALYYFYRPLSYLDGALTGTRTHIGPHR